MERSATHPDREDRGRNVSGEPRVKSAEKGATSRFSFRANPTISQPVMLCIHSLGRSLPLPLGICFVLTDLLKYTGAATAVDGLFMETEIGAHPLGWTEVARSCKKKHTLTWP